MPTYEEIVNALRRASQGVDFSSLYAQNPQLPALTPQHSPFWMWNAANEQGLNLIGQTLASLGFQPQRFDYQARMREQYPQMIHPEREMPFLQVGNYELNPARWLDYMRQGSYSQLANELLNAQGGAPGGGTSGGGATVGGAIGGGATGGIPNIQGGYEAMVPYFQQMLGGWSPEERQRLIPLVQALYNYFSGGRA